MFFPIFTVCPRIYYECPPLATIIGIVGWRRDKILKALKAHQNNTIASRRAILSVFCLAASRA